MDENGKRIAAWRASKEAEWGMPGSKLRTKHPTRELFEAWLARQADKGRSQAKAKAAAAAIGPPSGWSTGLAQADAFEWLATCCEPDALPSPARCTIQLSPRAPSSGLLHTFLSPLSFSPPLFLLPDHGTVHFHSLQPGPPHCDPPPSSSSLTKSHTRLCTTDQLRCADDKVGKNGTPHGPSDPASDSNTIKTDFLQFCLAVKRTGAVPAGWSWSTFLKTTATLVWQPATEADAKTRWG